MIVKRKLFNFNVTSPIVGGGQFATKEWQDEKKKEIENKKFGAGSIALGTAAAAGGTAIVARDLLPTITKKPIRHAGKIGAAVGGTLALGSLLAHNKKVDNS